MIFMRKILSAEVNHVDTQMAVHYLSENFSKLGIEEKDVISMQKNF